MKKNKILLILLSLALASTVVLAGCEGGSSYSSINVVGTQDTTYAVHSQGGNAVQYGNYVYFINGTAGYTDEDGTANVWNKVTKGALYRAELNGQKSSTEKEKYNASKFDIEGKVGVSGDYIEFSTHVGQDYDDNDIDVAYTQLIAPKVIGTSGYASGGIFIYDNYVYYATPNNQKNKAGDVQYTKTDFLRTSLDGKTTQKIFTTSEKSTDSPYAFYKQDGKVYLVVLDGSVLKSVVMNDKKVVDTLQIAENVTSAYLPVKSDYYSDDRSVSAEDYIYFARSAEKTDVERNGTVLEFVRPNGEERTIWRNDGQTASIDSVRDGVVFYRTSVSGNTVINYTNLHDVFMGQYEDEDNSVKGNSPTYRAYEDTLDESNKRTHVEGTVVNVSNLSSYTYVYGFRPGADQDPNTNVACVLASTGSELRLFDSLNASHGKLIYGQSATVSAVYDDYAYFIDGSNNAVRVNIFEENKTAETVSDRSVVSGGLPLDVCAGHIVYFGDIDDWAKGYTLFKKLPGNGPEGSKDLFVGERAKDDVKPEDDDEE